jgi:hypothetical protein
MNIIKQPSALGNRDALRDKVIERESKKAGLKGKIRAFCCHCIYDPYSEGSWLKQVENCTSSHCPLFTVRPVPSSKKEASGNG